MSDLCAAADCSEGHHGADRQCRRLGVRIHSVSKDQHAQAYHLHLEHSPYPFSSTYNASKAAMHAYSNTLRVELAPFDVDVIIVMSGRFQSRLSRNQRMLKPGSLYKPIKDEYAKRVDHSQADATPTDAFAASVVSQLLRPNPPLWIWEGKQSKMVWFLDGFVPRIRVHSTFEGMFE